MGWVFKQMGKGHKIQGTRINYTNVGVMLRNVDGHLKHKDGLKLKTLRGYDNIDTTKIWCGGEDRVERAKSR